MGVTSQNADLSDGPPDFPSPWRLLCMCMSMNFLFRLLSLIKISQVQCQCHSTLSQHTPLQRKINAPAPKRRQRRKPLRYHSRSAPCAALVRAVTGTPGGAYYCTERADSVRGSQGIFAGAAPPPSHRAGGSLGGGLPGTRPDPSFFQYASLYYRRAADLSTVPAEKNAQKTAPAPGGRCFLVNAGYCRRPGTGRTRRRCRSGR